jgi:LuxR family transcriptional regulator, quorum-sensing system regulator SolR
MRNKGIDLSKNIAITSSAEVKEICSPLEKYFSITYFNYVKLFKNSSRFVLTSGPEFTQRYYVDESLYSTAAVLNMEQLKAPSVHLFCEFQDQPSYIVSRNEFNIDNGITIIQPSPCGKETELFYFATKRENYRNIYLYNTNLDVFNRFIVYFKEKAHNLIKRAERERFYITVPPADKILFENEKYNRTKFYMETNVNKLHLNLDSKKITLSKREIDCFRLSLQNNTAKEIARILKLSPRTIESYLDNLKIKTNCQTKNELIYKFKGTFYESLLRYAGVEA